ncbi:MAG TPA: 50S ribosomal protein L9 [Gammaproteobacteria bacterium]|nr:50S ribosomal protein L9 [Gammaproteobacteria bacterium]
MKVILLEKIKRLGNLGESVQVKSGYARNFLIPQKKAVFATAVNIARFEAKRAELEGLAADDLAKATARAAALNELTIVIPANASEEGKLFGSLGVRELTKAITDSGVEVENKEVLLPEGPIKMLGEYKIDIQLHSDVTATVNVLVQMEAK